MNTLVTEGAPSYKEHWEITIMGTNYTVKHYPNEHPNGYDCASSYGGLSVIIVHNKTRLADIFKYTTVSPKLQAKIIKEFK